MKPCFHPRNSPRKLGDQSQTKFDKYRLVRIAGYFFFHVPISSSTVCRIRIRGIRIISLDPDLYQKLAGSGSN